MSVLHRAQVQAGCTLPLPDDPSACPPALRDLALRCWRFNHRERPSSREAVEVLEGIMRGMGLELPPGK